MRPINWGIYSSKRRQIRINPQVNPKRRKPNKLAKNKDPRDLTVSGIFFGAPDRDRIHNLLIRSQTLYPVELRARVAVVAAELMIDAAGYFVKGQFFRGVVDQ